ncbi:MAG TPA: zf-HC2 domain-containing protein [Gammaproteobacteria bacterium]
MNGEHRHRIDCRRAAELLPWHVNRSLSRDERADIESHLRECIACAREAEFLAAVRTAMPAPANEHETAPFSRLLQRINSEEQRTRSWKMAAVALLMLGGFTAVALPVYLLEPRFHTVTDTIPQPAGSVQLQLQFTADGNASTLPRLLESYSADIVSGPDADGKFVLEFRLDAGENAAALRQRLRKEAQVIVVDEHDDLSRRDAGR